MGVGGRVRCGCRWVGRWAGGWVGGWVGRYVRMRKYMHVNRKMDN